MAEWKSSYEKQMKKSGLDSVSRRIATFKFIYKITCSLLTGTPKDDPSNEPQKSQATTKCGHRAGSSCPDCQAAQSTVQTGESGRGAGH